MAREKTIDYSVWAMKGIGTIGTTHYKIPESAGLRGVFEEIAISVAKKSPEVEEKIRGFKNMELVQFILSFNGAYRSRQVRYIRWKNPETGFKEEINLTLKTIVKILDKNFNFK